MNQKTKPKVFCFVLPSFFIENKGGAELQCYYLARELVKRGWQVHYIREYRHTYPEKSYCCQGIQVHALKHRRNGLRWLNTIQLKRLMRHINADYYYLRASISYVYPIVLNAKKLGNPTVIWACSHDNELFPPVKKNNIILHTLDRLNYTLFSRALQKMDLILLQTHDQRRMLENIHALTGRVLYNAHPNCLPSQVAQKNDSILWIGRLQKWKHPEKFIRLAKALANRPYQFIAIGKPLKGNDLENQMAIAHQTLSNFTFTGELDNEAVCALIATARLLVCTSESEGFSNTFIEAWARGVPVVSLTVNPDHLLHTYNTGLVSGSMAQLVRDVDLLMTDHKKWQALSDHSIAFFNKKLTIDTYTDRFEEIIKNGGNS